MSAKRDSSDEVVVELPIELKVWVEPLEGKTFIYDKVAYKKGQTICIDTSLFNEDILRKV
jgi:hypothetical protein